MQAASGLVALVLGGCGPASGRVAAAECYALRFAGAEDADTTLFPRALLLAPGADGGAVAAGPGDSRTSAFWGMFGPGAAWTRLPTDSVGVTFSNGYSATALVVAHDGRRLRGTAAFRFEEGGEPYPLLEIRGARVDCAGGS